MSNFHSFKQGAAQHIGDTRSVRLGHISTYDAKSGYCRVIYPTLLDYNGKPIESPPIRLGTIWAGNGFGFQFHPHGGSTPDKPTVGEAVIVGIEERDTGVAYVANFVYGPAQMPPAGALGLAPGEGAFVHESGSTLRFFANGDVGVGTANSLYLQATNNVVVTAGADLVMSAGNNLQASAQKTVSINGERITTKSEQETQMEAGKKFNVLSEDTLSLASGKNMNLTAFENIGILAQETMVLAAKNITQQTDEAFTVGAGTRMVLVSNQGSSFSSNTTVNINAEQQITIDGGKVTYLTADALNILTHQSLKDLPEVQQVKRVRPKGWENIGDWKANQKGSDSKSGQVRFGSAPLSGPFGSTTGTGTVTSNRTHSTSGRLSIGGQLQEITNAAESFQGDTETRMVNFDGVPVFGYDAKLDPKYGGGIAGPSSAETISGPGSIPRGAAKSFKPAASGEIVVDAAVRIKLESKRTEVLADRTVKILSKDETQIGAQRLAGFAAPSLKIRAIQDQNSDLTILGSRINISSRADFTDGSYKEIKISTPGGGDLTMDLGKDLQINTDENILLSATGTAEVVSFDMLSLTSLSTGVNVGNGGSAPILISTAGNLILHSPASYAYSVANATYHRLVDERFITQFNNHAHSGVSPGGGSSGSPTSPVASNTVCTDIFKAA